MFWKPGVIKLGGYFTKHRVPAHHKGTIPVYLHCTNSVQASSRVCYSKSTSNRIQVKPMSTGGYNNIETQSGVRTKYVTFLDVVQTKPSATCQKTEHIHIIITSAQEAYNLILTQVWDKPPCGAIRG